MEQYKSMQRKEDHNSGFSAPKKVKAVDSKEKAYSLYSGEF